MPSLQGSFRLIVKPLLSILGLVLVVCLAGCGSDEATDQASETRSSSAAPAATEASIDKLTAREAELVAAMTNPPVALERVYELASVRADLAIDAYAHGNEALAFDLLTNSLTIDPIQPDRWERLGDWALQLETPDRNAMAYSAYSNAHDLRPKLPRTLMKLAAINTEYGRWNDAIDQIEAALESPQTAIPEWTHLTLLIQLYIRAERTGQGMAFLNKRFEATYDDRYLLALAVLMDGLGQGEPAARIAANVARRTTLPEALRTYAERLAERFAAAGNSRLYGETRAAKTWGATR